MRVLSQGQLGPGLARALVALFVWSVLGSGIATIPVSAQVSTRSATNTQSTAVVPFCNNTAYHRDSLGDEVAALVASDLEKRLSLDVLGVDEVKQDMDLLGMKVPLDTPSLVRLADKLEVSNLVWGEVREAALVVDKNKRRFGQVTLAIHLFSRVAQGDTNGALVTGYSSPDLNAAGDELVSVALKQAVFQAITEMKTRPSVSAEVIWAKGVQVFSNAGSRRGILVGLKLAAVRDGERIAIVRVNQVNGTGLDGEVIEGAQLRTGDHLYALYDVPGEACPPTLKERAVTSARGSEKLGILAGIALLLAGAARGNTQVANGNTNPGGFLASGLSNGVVLEYTNPLSYPTNILTWTKFSNTQTQRILGYKIFRNNTLVDFVAPRFEGDDQFAFDLGNWIPQGTPGCAWTGVTVSVDPLTGGVTFDGNMEFWTPVDNNGVLSPTWDDWQAGLFVGEANASDSYELGILRNPFMPGLPIVYRIQPIVLENTSNNASLPNWVVKQSTTTSQPSNSMVPCGAPALDQAMLVGSVASFLFYHPMGADEMVLQVQRDQGLGGQVDFAPGPTTYQQTLTSLNPNVNGDLLIMQVDISTLQDLQGTGDIYWWRVGAHNRADTVAPRAWPLDPNSPDNAWVWNFPQQRVDLSASVGRATHAQGADRVLKQSGASPKTRRSHRDRQYNVR